MQFHFICIIKRIISFSHPANDFSPVSHFPCENSCKCKCTSVASRAIKFAVLIFTVTFYTKATPDFSISNRNRYAPIGSKSRAIDAKWHRNFKLADSVERLTGTSKKMRACVLHVSARAVYTCVPLAQVHLITGSNELSRPLKEINCPSNVRASGFDSTHDGSSRAPGGIKILAKGKESSRAWLFAYSDSSPRTRCSQRWRFDIFTPFRAKRTKYSNK